MNANNNSSCRGQSGASEALRVLGVAVIIVCIFLLSGCTAIAVKMVGGTVDSLRASAARDDDPELVADALPMGLKLLEAGLLQKPKAKGLLLSACSGFTQYAQAFVVQPADFLEDTDLTESRRQRQRGGRLFLRARGYCLRAMEAAHKGVTARLAVAPVEALRKTRKKDVPLLFWTGASWAGAINVSRSEYDLVADLGVAHELLKRALALQPDWEQGMVHELLISLEAARAPNGGSFERAREHFRLAMEASGGKKIGPLVTVAESVAVKEQDYAEFKRLLTKALEFDTDSAPDNRLANTLAQRRAQWLLDREEDLFVEVGP